MCGIGFIIGKTPNELRSHLNSMVLGMRHRGPDASGILIKKISSYQKIGFMHTRLSLLDLSIKGNQPMKDEKSGNILVYNGEIYNYLDIKKQLEAKGEMFQSTSDTEVILKAYRHYGLKKLIKKINGMYSFVIWDEKEKCTIIVRDKFGIKPLYYISNKSFFACSSECTSLIKSNLSNNHVCQFGIDSYLAYGSVQPPNTIYKNIKCLLPGHALIVNSDGKINQEMNLWSNEQTKVFFDFKFIEDKFKGIIKNYYRADVPIGIFLSGGYDSSLLAFITSKISSNPVHTFNMKFSSEPEFSEHEKAKMISKEIKSIHHEIDVNKEMMLNSLKEFFQAMDQPTDDGINIFLLSKFVKKNKFKSCFHGIGGDELLGGYSSFKLLPKLKYLKFIPNSMRKLVTFFLSDNSISSSKVKAVLLSDLSLFETYLIRRQNFSYNQRKQLLKNHPPLGVLGIDKKLKNFLLNKIQKCKNDFEKISTLELYQYCSNKLLIDCDVMSMASSLEVRLPYLDLEFINSLQNEALIGKTKLASQFNGFPLKLMSKTKTGFTLPFKKWLNEENIESSYEEIEILHKKFSFDQKYLKNILIKNELKGEYSWLRRWQLKSLVNWYKEKL